MENWSHVAGGTIRPARFVKLSGAADFTVLEADANERVCGISGESQRDAPQTGASDSAASAGEPVHVNPLGRVCLLELGSGGTTRGNKLKSDADGKGVDAATTGTTMQWVGAEALQSGSEGDIIKVLVVNYPHYPALT